MIKVILLIALASAANAASLGANIPCATTEQVPLLKYENNVQPDGSFNFLFETGDKSFREETGVIENAGTEDEALEVHGSYRYVDPDGREIEVHYTAGRNGFVPVGTNILSEISAQAKAAADLPSNSLEDNAQRQGRSKNLAEGKEKKSEKPKIPEKEIHIPVQVIQIVDDVKVPEQPKSERKLAKNLAVKEVQAVEKIAEEKKSEVGKPDEKKPETETVEIPKEDKPAEKVTDTKKQEVKKAPAVKHDVKDPEENKTDVKKAEEKKKPQIEKPEVKKAVDSNKA